MATNPAALLINASGEIFQIKTTSVSLGRAADNHVVFNSDRTSRYHALILFSEGVYIVRDLDSKNGVRVNGLPIQGQQPLYNGDELAFGDVRFTFKTPEAAEMETVTFEEPPLNPAGLGPSSRLQLDLPAMQVILDGEILHPPLSLLEWKLLVLLYQNRGKVCHRDTIVEELYHPLEPDDIPYNSAIETLVSRLRRRLGLHYPDQLPYIKAIRGVGYRLEF